MNRNGALFVVGILATVLVACGSSASGTGAGSTTAPQAAAPPPAATTTTTSGATSVMAMGHLDDPSNTFYELFDRPAGASTWSLRTPPGVADNGGLVVGASDAGTLIAGFLPSADLTFSVLASSVDRGTTWSPGNVPGALAPEPDALATAGSDGADGVVAVLSGAEGRVVASDSALTSWHTLASSAALAGPMTRCTVAAVTAVAVSASGSPVIGVRCASSSVIGLFVPSATPGSWTPIGPAFGGRGPSTTTVLRLHAWTGGTSALVEGRRSGATTVMGEWFAGSTTSAADVRGSPPLAVPPGWSVRATAVGGGTGAGLTVLLGADSGTSLKVESVAGPGQAWTEAPPPVGTTAVAVIGSETDAFVPSGSHLAIWAATAGSQVWARVARLTVPIQYGSSG